MATVRAKKNIAGQMLGGEGQLRLQARKVENWGACHLSLGDVSQIDSKLMQVRWSQSGAAVVSFLHRWALDRAEGTEYTTVAVIRAQHRLAVDALIKELTRVHGHSFSRGKAAVWTCQNRIEDGFAH